MIKIIHKHILQFKTFFTQMFKNTRKYKTFNFPTFNTENSSNIAIIYDSQYT